MREEFSRRNVYGDLNINRKGRKDREAAIRLVMHQMLAKNRIDRRCGMSDKKRRDITLGEMQDECRRFESPLCGGKACAYVDLCNQIKSGYTPHAWDLSDPPRFNEAQMAFWRGWLAVGARFVKRRFGTGCVDFSLTTKDFCVSNSCVLPSEIAIQLEEGKVYDLAELLGKDGAEC